MEVDGNDMFNICEWINIGLKYWNIYVGVRLYIYVLGWVFSIYCVFIFECFFLYRIVINY